MFCPKRVFKTRFKTRHLFQSLCPRFAIFLFQMSLFCFDFLDVVDVVFKFCGSQWVKYSLFCFSFSFWWSFQRRWLFGFAFHYSIFFAWSFCSACFVVQLIIFNLVLFWCNTLWLHGSCVSLFLFCFAICYYVLFCFGAFSKQNAKRGERLCFVLKTCFAQNEAKTKNTVLVEPWF